MPLMISKQQFSTGIKITKNLLMCDDHNFAISLIMIINKSATEKNVLP